MSRGGASPPGEPSASGQPPRAPYAAPSGRSLAQVLRLPVLTARGEMRLDNAMKEPPSLDGQYVERLRRTFELAPSSPRGATPLPPPPLPSTFRLRPHSCTPPRKLIARPTVEEPPSGRRRSRPAGGRASEAGAMCVLGHVRRVP